MNRSGIGGYLQIAFHPILFGILPVIILFTSNIKSISVHQTYRSFLATLGLAVVLFLVLRLCLRDWHRTALILSLFFFFFYNFRSMVIILSRIYQNFGLVTIQIAAAVTAAGMALVIMIQARMKIRPKVFTPIFNVIALFLLAYNLSFVGARSVQASLLETGKPAALDPVFSEIGGDDQPAAEGKPDVYYIVLDSYVRPDVFQELYGQGNDEFIRYLRSKGFYVAEQSHSNYSQTLLSASCTLNMQYLDDQLALDPNQDDRTMLKALLQKSAVTEIFKNLGYRIYSFENGYDLIDIADADVFIPARPEFNPFEQELLVNSIAFLFEKEIRVQFYPEQMLNRLNQLETLVDAEGPKFVYAHLLVTHPPFIFDRDGNLREKDAYWGDGISFVGTRAEYRTGYTEQMLYTNQRMTRLIDRILAHPERRSIIILQGDHGSGLNPYTALEKVCYRERFSILNAYYLPGEGKETLYPQITPVNTFRVILNATFQANLPLAPDRSYYSTWEKPFRFYEASPERLNQPCAAE